jgi:parallel beta-helix repeat protein
MSSRSIASCAVRLALVAAAVGGACALASERADARVIRVRTTIQAAVDEAESGDTIKVPGGTYRENVVVTKGGLTISGGKAAVLDGTGLEGETGITVRSDDPTARIAGFTLMGLTIRNYSEYGVYLERVDGFEILNGRYVDDAEYAVYPVLSSGGRVAFNQVSGSNDSGIYIGQSDDVVIEKNHTTDNTVGIEVENSSNITVRNNKATANSVGVLVVVLPLLEVKATSDVTIDDNVLNKNNRPNTIDDPLDILSRLPAGVGVLNVGGDRVVMTNNKALRNDTAGIGVISLPDDVAALDPEIDPAPDANEVRSNKATNNGANPDPRAAPLPGVDIVWDGTGEGNCWSSNVTGTSFPATLPACP